MIPLAARSALFPAILAAALAAPSAFGQHPPPRQDPPSKDLTEMSLEELLKIEVTQVYAASRYVQKISEAPATISVTTAEEIRRLGHRTLADALRSMRGVYVTYDRNYSYLGVRGFGIPTDYNDRVLFLVDGPRINDNVYDGTLFGGEFILDIDTVERIEFVRGPASSLYGSNAFFGVVNVTTKSGRKVDGLETSASAGSFGTYKGRVSYGKRLESGVEVLLSGSFLSSDGQALFYREYDDPTTGSGVARHADGESYSNFLAKASWSGLSLEAAYVTRRKEVPTGAYGTVFPSRGTETRDSRGYLELKYDREFEDRLHLTTRVSLDGYWYRGNYEYVDTSSGSPVLYRNVDDTLGAGWSAEAVLSKALWEDRAKWVVGGEFRDNFRQVQKNFDSVDPKVTYLDSREESYFVAAFGQADVRVLPELRLNAGLRLDDYDTFGTSVNPRAGAIYTPTEGTTVKALYGRAFRAPSAYELFYQDGGILQKANPDLDPESIDTYELALEQDLGSGLHLTATAFHYECREMITAVLDPLDGLLFFDNVDRVRTTGGELELRARLEGGLQGGVSVSVQKAENRETKSWLPNSPRQVAKLDVTVPLFEERLFAGFELQVLGRRKSVAREDVHGHLLANLTLFSHDLVKGLEISASVYNLLGERYFDPAGNEHLQDQIEQDGTSFRLNLTYRF